MKTYEPYTKEEKTWAKIALVFILIIGVLIIVSLLLSMGKQTVMHHLYEEIDNSNI
jgi:heme/copper-type cytochrome/quinol oxidase subunit 4